MFGFGSFKSISSGASTLKSASSKVSSAKSQAMNLKNQASGFKNQAMGLKNQAMGLKNQAMGKVGDLKAKAASLKNGIPGLKTSNFLSPDSESFMAVGAQDRFNSDSSTAGMRDSYPSYRSGESAPNTRLENYLFVFELDGIQGASFEEISGLQVKNSIIEVDEGGANDSSRKLYDRTHYSNLILRRGVTDNLTVYEYVMNFINDPECQKTGMDAAVTIRTLDGFDIQTINLYGVIPVSWSIPRLRANTGYPIEYLELAVESVSMGTGTSSGL